MKTLFQKTSKGSRLVLLAFMVLFFAASVQAQSPHGRPQPPTRHQFDSLFRSRMDSIVQGHVHCKVDSSASAHAHDSLPPHSCIPGSAHWADSNVVIRDSFPFPPHRDSTNAGGGHHDSIPTPPLPPNWSDSSNAGGGHHGHDSIPTPPVPPNWNDSSSTGGDHHGHDTIPTPPVPPNWGDSSWTGDHGQDSVPHHKDFEINSTETTSSMTVLVYPNPMFESATLNIQNASSEVTFRMFTSTGQIIMTKTGLTTGNYTIDKGNLAPGIYFYNMLDGNTVAAKGSVVIR